jgi:hypothetical protein
MLACRRACHPGLSAMAIDKACAWSRRRTQARAGRLTRSIAAQEIVPCAPSSSAAAASSPVEEPARRGLRLLFHPACPPKPCAWAAEVAPQRQM